MRRRSLVALTATMPFAAVAQQGGAARSAATKSEILAAYRSGG